MQLKIYIFIFGCILLFNSHSQVNDTLNIIEVYSKKDSILKTTIINSNVPHYKLDKLKLNELSSDDIGEALKFIPGTYIKDYGGIGGLKTVSYRSLGAAHTGIEIDGVILPNTQTGTVNLSNFDVFSIGSIEMTSGQVQNHYSTASSYVKANVLSLNSDLYEIPEHQTEVRFLGSASTIHTFEGGLLLKQKINNNFSFGAQSLYNFGSGQFPYSIQNFDSTNTGIRQNSDYKNFKIKGALNYQKNKLKIHINSRYSDEYQNLPGAIVLYNPYNDQSLANSTFNSTISLRYLTTKYAVGINSFYQKANTTYRDNQYLNSQGFIEYNYRNESIGGGFILNRFLSSTTQKIFIGSDIKSSSLVGNQFFNTPSRLNINSVLGISKWVYRFKLQGNLSHQYILDQTPQTKKELSHFSPFISAAYLPFKHLNLRLRSHYKNTFRLPSFNDLYYNSIGNSTLRAENASSYNLGVTFAKKLDHITTEITLDAYQNYIKDKIVAIPTKNLFNWSMQNIGSVLSQGMDLNLLLSFKKNIYKLDFTTSQSVNNSIDVTNPDHLTHGHQIPYTPKYTASYTFTFGYKKTNLTSTLIHSGSRYTINENLPFNLLPGFVDVGIGINRVFNFKQQSLYTNLWVGNILNQNYEVIRSFPMPGRFIKLKLIYSFKR